jgi:hypothetical protein
MPKFVCSQKDVHHGKRTAASYNPLAAGNAGQAFLLPATQQQMGNCISQYSFTPVSSSTVTTARAPASQ